MALSNSSILCAALVVVAVISTATEATSEQEVGRYPLTDGRLVEPLQVFQECPVCPEMIALPTGAFMMGAKPEDSRNPLDIFGPNPSFQRRDPGEPNIIPQEHPRHRVAIDIPFAMGRNEVTYAEWMACVADDGCAHVPEHRIATPDGPVTLGPDHPVMDVSYLDALEYVAWLNRQVGAEVYRLPVEAEWEYAARAGTETRFAQGDDLTADQANFSRRGTEQLRGREMPDLVDRRMPVRVDELDAANRWGLRHMSGNLNEITLSCWSEMHLGLASSSMYLMDAETQDDCNRVVKGGGYHNGMDYLRPAKRGQAFEPTRLDTAGFRVLRQFENGIW